MSRWVRAGALALVASACAAERHLAVTSEPTGAAVEIDGQKLGYTPFELEFEHYGVRQVTLSLPGYTTWTKLVRLRAPWYGRFPLDLVSEILLPIGWEDRHEVHAVLEPQEGEVADPDLQAVLARARALRAIMEGPRAARPAKPAELLETPPTEAADPPAEPPPDGSAPAGGDDRKGGR